MNNHHRAYQNVINKATALNSKCWWLDPDFALIIIPWTWSYNTSHHCPHLAFKHWNGTLGDALLEDYNHLHIYPRPIHLLSLGKLSMSGDMEGSVHHLQVIGLTTNCLITTGVIEPSVLTAMIRLSFWCLSVSMNKFLAFYLLPLLVPSTVTHPCVSSNLWPVT